jgi:hypothetical protein
MKKIVVLPGGYHPYHAGHYSLFKAAEEKFPDADVYLAATNDTKTRPFPFEIKKKLAQLAGVNPDQFVQVKSPFKAEEITQKYNPEQDVLIFVRSEKDRDEQPKPGGTKKDGSPSYFQPYDPDNLESFNKHAYMEYLPTIEFGPGIKSATEIRNAWPNLNERQKLAMVMSLYPRTQQNKKLADVAVKMLDAGIIGDQVNEEGVAEGWKDVVAGGALALASLGANAQTSDMDNIQQYTQLTKQYYEALVDRAENEDGFVLDRRDLNRIKAKAQDMAAAKVAKQKQSNTQNNNSSSNSFPSQGSERRVASDRDQFESMDVEEATLINDPEQGHLIVPDGGMGTWDEQSLLSNLTRKFSSMVEMIKEKRYSNLYHSLYEAGVVENMLKALVEYENFKTKQGNRPIAKNRSIDISQVNESTDYISEK